MKITDTSEVSPSFIRNIIYMYFFDAESVYDDEGRKLLDIIACPKTGVYVKWNTIRSFRKEIGFIERIAYYFKKKKLFKALIRERKQYETNIG